MLDKPGLRKFRSRLRGDGHNQLDDISKKYLGGDYKAVVLLTRQLVQGLEAKAIIDAIIDMCDSMQNLREAIFDLKLRSQSSEISGEEKTIAHSRGLHYLRRYYQLIEFVHYLHSLPVTSRAGIRERFSTWIRSRPELKNPLRQLTME